MPTFAVLNNAGLYLKVTPDLKLNWVSSDPNKYTSKYAAKRHLKELDITADNVKVVPLLTEEG